MLLSEIPDDALLEAICKEQDKLNAIEMPSALDRVNLRQLLLEALRRGFALRVLPLVKR